MSDSGRPLTTGWKIAIVAALLIALANGGVSALREQGERQFRNHEERIDDLENRVRGNRASPEGIERSHEKRIEALENKVRELQAVLDAAKAKPAGKGG